MHPLPTAPAAMLKPPDHQVAGHHARDGKLGPLIDGSGRFYKPLQSQARGANELSFYTRFSSSSDPPLIPPHIRPFFPAFHGTLLLPASDGSGPHPHLILDDLLFGLRLPSVIDLKIGSRTWSPSDPEHNIRKCLAKDRQTTSALLGFRISGLQTNAWRPARDQVRRFQPEDVRRALRRFVSSGGEEADRALACAVYGGAEGVVAQLVALKAWFEEQTRFHFCSASVLVAYGEDARGRRARVRVRLVDFAHVAEGDGVIDHNFLGGLCSLIKFFADVLRGIDEAGAMA